MHSNLLAIALCFLAVPEQVLARPSGVTLHSRRVASVGRAVHPASLRRRGQKEQVQQAQQISCTATPAGEVKQEAAAGEAAAGEAAAGEEKAKENEVEIESAFDAAVPVQGGELKQDLVFTPSTVGKFEYEFQAAAADEITVTENKTPGAAPAGFEAIEPNSYVVKLAKSKGAGLTLSKIDYIFDATAAGIQGKDVTKAQVGRLCPETGSFVISETLGELEFELEENEVTLNLNKNVTAEGEWGIFLPIAAAAGAGKEAAAKAPAAKAPAAKTPAAKAPAAKAPAGKGHAAAPEAKGKGSSRANNEDDSEGEDD